MKSTGSQFTPGEIRKLRALRTPWGIQKFLDSIPYHHAGTAWSPRLVLQKKTAHCLEGAIFAAAALRVLGYPPLVFDLEAYRDDDHVLAVFQEGKHWGAIAKSNFSGLRYRAPVYRTLRELAISYFENYFNLAGDRSLRRYATKPVDLSRFDYLDWMTREKDVWFVAERLCEIPHTAIMTPRMERALTRLDKRSLEAGKFGRQ
jgi:hypothetical protein